jgi:Ca2+-binding RTX toxin-like protein
VVADLAAGTATPPSSAVTLSGIEDVVGTDQADVIGGDGGPNLLGGGFAPRTDKIDGRGGDDDLRGGAGDDVLAGGAGTNTIRGGTGRDTCTDPGPGQTGATGCET